MDFPFPPSSFFFCGFTLYFSGFISVGEPASIIANFASVELPSTPFLDQFFTCFPLPVSNNAYRAFQFGAAFYFSTRIRIGGLVKSWMRCKDYS
jgi:hypothetical protein